MTSMRLSTPSSPTACAPRMRPSLAREDELEVDGLGARVVAGVVPRVQVDDAVVGDARAAQALLAGARGARRQTQHADDGRALHAAEARRAPRDGLGRDAPLAVGRAGERQDRSPVRRRRRAPRWRRPPRRSPDRSCASGRPPRCRRVLPMHQTRRLRRAAPRAARRSPGRPGPWRCGSPRSVTTASAIALALDRAEPLAEAQLHALAAQVGRQRRGHLGVERRHHLRQLLDDGHRRARGARGSRPSRGR